METEETRVRDQAAFHGLQVHIAALWQWEPGNYPLLDPTLYQKERVPRMLQFVFAAPHVLTHLNGALGTIAKHIEPCGHGKPFTEEQRAAVEEAIAKVFVNGLMLAKLLDIEAGRIPEVMRRIMDEQVTKINEHRRDHGIVG